MDVNLSMSTRALCCQHQASLPDKLLISQMMASFHLVTNRIHRGDPTLNVFHIVIHRPAQPRCLRPKVEWSRKCEALNFQCLVMKGYMQGRFKLDSVDMIVPWCSGAGTDNGRATVFICQWVTAGLHRDICLVTYHIPIKTSSTRDRVSQQ